MNERSDQTALADRVALALEALTERAFNRCLFPIEVKEACAALDAYGWPSLSAGCRVEIIND